MAIGSDEQLANICRIIRQGGQYAKSNARQSFEVFEKGVDDYVTSIDRHLDREFMSAFSTLFPDDGVITEENARSRSAYPSPHQRLWLIDPLDGTDDYIQGHSHYAVMVGLLDHYQPIAGWIYAPEFDVLYGCTDTRTLFQIEADQMKPLAPVEPPPPSNQFCPILIGTKDHKRYGEAIAQRIPAAQFSTLGSFGLKVMEVVCGRAGLYLYFNRRVKLWDTTGPIAIARAAGLVCCDLEGQPLQFSPDSIEPTTLAHLQPILVGWPSYIDLLRPYIQEAIDVRF